MCTHAHSVCVAPTSGLSSVSRGQVVAGEGQALPHTHLGKGRRHSLVVISEDSHMCSVCVWAGFIAWQAVLWVLLLGNTHAPLQWRGSPHSFL